MQLFSSVYEFENFCFYLKPINILKNWHDAKHVLKKKWCFNVAQLKNLWFYIYFVHFNNYCWYSDTMQCYNLYKLLSVYRFYFHFLLLLYRVRTLSMLSTYLSEKLLSKLWPSVTKMTYVEGTNNSLIAIPVWNKLCNLELCIISCPVSKRASIKNCKSICRF